MTEPTAKPFKFTQTQLPFTMPAWPVAKPEPEPAKCRAQWFRKGELRTRGDADALLLMTAMMGNDLHLLHKGTRT